MMRATHGGLRPWHDDGVIRVEAPIETARLIVRPFRQSDLTALADIHGRPEVARYLYWEARSLDEVRTVLVSKITQSTLQHEGRRLTLAVELPATKQLVGEVTLAWLSREHRQGEIGFILHPDFQGRGMATEAAGVMLRLGFEGLDLHRIIGRCDARNLGSARVMERLGMRREAHFVESEVFKGDWGDELIYAILQHEWATIESANSDREAVGQVAAGRKVMP
jgi:RimJ/RimL family protein N-acetyltransferase